jgi:CheY-like chemotaxis protein
VNADDEPRPAPTSDGLATEDSPAATGPPRHRVLVVDDNVDGAESMTFLLHALGQDVSTAYDGEQALEQFQSFRPDVVLMDIGLPRLNGYDAARRIRQMPGGGGILLVALTGWGQDEDRQQSREAGFDHHWVKPVDFAVLRELLGLRS